MNGPQNFAVSAVKDDSDHKFIVKAKVHLEPSHFLLGEWYRNQIVLSICKGNRWTTILEEGADWRKGADIHVVEVGGRKYLRTDGNEVEEDNLGELPGF